MGRKTAGPIRRGFGYQDLVALMFALEMYVENRRFEMYLEYGRPGGLDDIVIITGDEVHAYQVKHAENAFDTFTGDDFTNKTDKRTCFSAFSQSWDKLKREYSGAKVVCHLFSNRGLDRSLIHCQV